MLAVNTEHRELTLMFTDIVGYSRLMGRDEALTIDMLGQYREILLAHIHAQGGVFVEFAGDAIFARFDSALAAVNAAIAIQQHLHEFNAARDKKLPKLQTRIGLHKGEAMLRDNAVLGDNVNIAARLEPLAVPDGICLSNSVYDDIRYNLSSPAKPLGIQSLKNIDHKVRAYLIKPSGIGWRDHLHYFLSALNKKIAANRYPLIVCLLALIAAGVYFIPRWLVPGYAANYVEIADFKNLMNEKGDADYFSAGITEAVRSQLADMRDVYIVEADKGIHAPIRLEGSVQKLGNNLRIAYRLFRRNNNVQIAGGKLDGTYQDIFILQDRLVGEIARYLADEFKLQNFRPAPLKLTNDITAYDYYLQGLEFLEKPSSQENFDEAIQRFNQALVHDSEFARANTGLCETYRRKYELTNSSNWFEQAEYFCLKALEHDHSAKMYVSVGSIYRDSGKYEEAIKYFEQALSIEKNNVLALVGLARVYDLIGDDKLSETLYLQNIENSPNNWMTYQGYGYYLARKGRYLEAIQNYKNALNITPQNLIALNNIGGAYLYLGDFEHAAKSLEKATELEPSGGAFLNAGSMYYFSGDFDKSIKMYLEALRLEPNNVEVMVNLADAYNFIDNKKATSLNYSKMAVESATKEIALNPASVSALQFLALANLQLGNIFEAKKNLDIANTLDANNIVTLYIYLRTYVRENAVDHITETLAKLIAAGYSEQIILADPYFVMLKNEPFKSVLVKN